MEIIKLKNTIPEMKSSFSKLNRQDTEKITEFRRSIKIIQTKAEKKELNKQKKEQVKD